MTDTTKNTDPRVLILAPDDNVAMTVMGAMLTLKLDEETGELIGMEASPTANRPSRKNSGTRNLFSPTRASNPSDRLVFLRRLKPFCHRGHRELPG